MPNVFASSLSALAVALLCGPLASAQAQDPLVPTEQRMLRPHITAGVDEDFGTAVAIDGNRAIVGAPGPTGTGAAYIFERVGNAWVQQARLAPADLIVGDRFGESVAIDGNWAVVGAREHAELGFGAGAAYVFEFSAGVWTQLDKLVSSDPSPQAARFGSEVAVSGTTVAVAAFSHDDAALGANVGAVWVFERDGTSWDETKLMPSDLATNDNFGEGLALEGDTLLSGAPWQLPSGVVYAYLRGSAGWGFEAKLSAPDSPGRFGEHLALSGDAAAIAATDRVYVYARGASGWAEETPRPVLGSGFDTRPVDLHENLLIASRGNAAEIFVRTATGWLLHARMAVDNLDSGVAIGDGVAIAGALNTSTFGVQTGAAFVYVPQGSNYAVAQKLVPARGQLNHGFGYSIAVSGTEAAVLGFTYRASAQAYRMELIEGAWQQREALGTSLNVDIVSDVSFSGDTIAFGFMYPNQRSYVRVHERQMNGSWATSTLGTGTTDDGFARDVGVSGDSMLIGAYADDTMANNAGALYEATRTGSTWGAPTVIMRGTGASNLLGSLVLHGGDDALIGRSNAVLVLRKDDGPWAIEQTIPLSGGGLISGARDGDRAVIGDPNTGSVYVLTRSGTTWSHLTTLTSPVGGDAFGRSVALEGDRIAVSADDLDVPGSGVVYVYDMNSDVLQRVATIRPLAQTQFDRFGYGLEIADEQVLAGAYGADQGAPDSGAGYVYTLSPRRADGTPCAAGLECISGICTDGICCDALCDSSCQSCAALFKEDASADGSCEDARDGLTCGIASSCFSATEYALSPVCDGAGLCEPRGVPCADDFACTANRCPDDCQVMGVDTHALCADTHHCQAGACVVDRSVGVACSAPQQCESGSCVGGVCRGKVGDSCLSTACAPGAFCVDGYCCDEPCNEQCVACGEAGFEGSCVAVTGLPRGNREECVDDPDCGGSCNGSLRDGCAYPSAVACGTAACNAGQLTGNICNGLGVCVTGATSSCAPYTQCNGASACAISCSADNQCNASHFCNGITCVSDRIQGEACERDGQCATGHCVDGVCCNSECDGQCEACALNALDPQAGTCRAVSGDPITPRPTCIGEGTDCGGSCNGATRAACVYPSSNLCGVSSCASGALTDNVCNGLGSCVTGATTSCTPYLECSNASACATTCSADGQCAATHFCAAGSCNVDRVQGESCTRNAQCATGQCVDGVCCNTECDGQCEACDLGPTDTDRGQCRAVSGEPLGSRAACVGEGSACEGNCDGVEREACAYPSASSCGSSTCSNGIAYGALCNGQGACVINDSGLSCFPYAACADGSECLSSCGGNTQCVVGHFCDEAREPAACVLQRDEGEACTHAAECLSGFCADGVCCDTECTGQCEVCSLGDDDEDAGSCRPTPDGVAPVGDRSACRGGDDDEDEACAGSCDGAERDTCAYPAQGTACEPAACDGAVLQPARVCDGEGECLAGSTQDCGAYACDADRDRCNSRCESRGDCAAGALCRLDVQQCAYVPSVCIDAFTVELADGTQSSCDGHRCAGGECRERCDASVDCAPDLVCVDGDCVRAQSPTDAGTDAGVVDASIGTGPLDDAGAVPPPVAPPEVPELIGDVPSFTPNEGGCSCRVPGAASGDANGRSAVLLTLTLLGALLRRGRRPRAASALARRSAPQSSGGGEVPHPPQSSSVMASRSATPCSRIAASDAARSSEPEPPPCS